MSINKPLLPPILQYACHAKEKNFPCTDHLEQYAPVSYSLYHTLYRYIEQYNLIPYSSSFLHCSLKPRLWCVACIQRSQNDPKKRGGLYGLYFVHTLTTIISSYHIWAVSYTANLNYIHFFNANFGPFIQIEQAKAYCTIFGLWFSCWVKAGNISFLLLVGTMILCNFSPHI